MVFGVFVGAVPVAKNDTSIVLVEQVQSKILIMRGQKVILDSDLATLYGVTTSRLNEQVKRNHERFPSDFMFQLSQKEFNDLKSQFATSSSGWGGRRKLPCVFTEHGAIMAASVLNSERAVQASPKTNRKNRSDFTRKRRAQVKESIRHGHNFFVPGRNKGYNMNRQH